MGTTINDILHAICKYDKEDNDNVTFKKIVEDIINFYNENDRHHYSEITAYVLNELDENDEEYLTNNLSMIIRYFKEEKNEESYAIRTEKLYDHVVLQINQKTYNNKQRNILNEQLKSIKQYVDYSKNDLEKLFNEQKKIIDNLYSNTISILSIFSAVIIAFFGGINILGSALSNMHKVSKYRLTFVILVIGFVTFNIIFMLLYTISKLIEKPIRSECKNNICEECKEKDKFIKMRCFRKYPVAYLFNLISIGMMILIIIAYYKKL